MIVRRHGIVLRRRGRSVFLPWGALGASAHSKITGDWWILAMSFESQGDVLQSRDGYLIARGLAVSTSQFYFRRNGDAVIANLYSVRFDDLQQLIASVATRLATNNSKTLPTEIGEPLDEEFC